MILNSEIWVHCFGPNSVKLKWDIKELRRDKTVRGEISAIFGGKKVELRHTGRAVTPFGGLAVRTLGAERGRLESGYGLGGV